MYKLQKLYTTHFQEYLTYLKGGYDFPGHSPKLVIWLVPRQFGEISIRITQIVRKFLLPSQSI